jgi:hypothetical protein
MWGLEIEIKNANHNDAMHFHRAIGEALSHTMDDQGKYNARIKKRIVELEVSLNPMPLFTKPLSMIQPIEDSLGHSRKFDKIALLLVGVHKFVTKNI